MAKKLKSFDEQLYKKISIADLILFCLYLIEQKSTFERLAKECFSFFPKSFAFPSYPNLADSRKIDRPLRTLRKRKLISGDPKTSFSLTKIGKKRAEEIAKIFRQRKLFK